MIGLKIISGENYCFPAQFKGRYKVKKFFEVVMPEKDKISGHAAQRDEAEIELIKEFHAALYGGMARDTLDNSGVPFTGETLKESAKRFNELIEDEEFQALLLEE